MILCRTPRTDIVPVLTFSTPKGPCHDLPTIPYLSPRDEFSGKRFTEMPILRRHFKMKSEDGTVLEAQQVLQKRGLLLEVEIATTVDSSGIKGLALIDTGARLTCIDRRVAIDHLGLRPNGQVEADTPAGISKHDTFPCCISFPGGGGLPPMTLGKAISMEMTDGIYIALLGRDFLRDKMLVVDGIDGSFTLSW